MTSFVPTLRHYLLSTAVAALTGLGLGCVITTGGAGCDECGGIACHSQGTNESCTCDPGYEWEDPDDNNNFECNRIPPKAGDCTEDNSFVSGDECFCEDGFNWCSDDPNDLTCCVDDQQGSNVGTGPGPDDGDDDGASSGGSDDNADTDPDGGSSDDGGAVCEETPAVGNGLVPDDADCTEDGLVFCSNTDAEGPEGSTFWECAGGVWTENAAVMDENCVFDGFDFAYGCVDDGRGVAFDCGVGPGTDCSGAECNGCLDNDVIQYCDSSKLGADSCFRICTEDGDSEGITFDSGSCIDGKNGPECACCDEGEKGCEV